MLLFSSTPVADPSASGSDQFVESLEDRLCLSVAAMTTGSAHAASSRAAIFAAANPVINSINPVFLNTRSSETSNSSHVSDTLSGDKEPDDADDAGFATAARVTASTTTSHHHHGHHHLRNLTAATTGHHHHGHHHLRNLTAATTSGKTSSRTGTTATGERFSTDKEPDGNDDLELPTTAAKTSTATKASTTTRFSNTRI